MTVHVVLLRRPFRISRTVSIPTPPEIRSLLLKRWRTGMRGLIRLDATDNRTHQRKNKKRTAAEGHQADQLLQNPSHVNPSISRAPCNMPVKHVAPKCKFPGGTRFTPMVAPDLLNASRLKKSKSRWEDYCDSHRAAK
ncbi:hypothetical protein OF83DRAFT_511962 [Amylostereum chailletii]|nr:hypothetical protein OF83DRAFT_511962 [Amylostereum chailletii]